MTTTLHPTLPTAPVCDADRDALRSTAWHVLARLAAHGRALDAVGARDATAALGRLAAPLALSLSATADPQAPAVAWRVLGGDVADAAALLAALAYAEPA